MFGQHDEVALILTIMIIDTDDVGSEVGEIIENARYPNRCIAPHVMAIETREVDWNHGDHPINMYDTSAAEFERLFAESSKTARSKP